MPAGVVGVKIDVRHGRIQVVRMQPIEVVDLPEVIAALTALVADGSYPVASEIILPQKRITVRFRSCEIVVKCGQTYGSASRWGARRETGRRIKGLLRSRIGRESEDIIWRARRCVKKLGALQLVKVDDYRNIQASIKSDCFLWACIANSESAA